MLDEEKLHLVSLGKGFNLSQKIDNKVSFYIKEQAYKTPDKIAVICGKLKISYRDLYVRSLGLARKLNQEGIKSGSRVAVYSDPSLNMIIAVLGIVLSGAAYVPLDKRKPHESLKKIISNAAPSLIICENEKDCVFNVKTLEIDSLFRIENDDFVNFSCDQKNDLAYIIYTSGSTGEPKGVAVGHRQLAASTQARRDVYGGEHVFLLLSSLAFDSSVAGIWGTLTSGGTLVIANKDEMRDPEKIVELITLNNVSHLLCIPSLYDNILNELERAKLQNIRLKTAIVAGEILQQKTLEKHFLLFDKGVELVNEYGPTEATVWASYERYKNCSKVSIGNPVPGISLYVLNDDLEFIGQGEKGELFIAGYQIAEGYFNQPEKTNEVFFDDILSKGGKMYKTGDFVRWNEEGNLEFLGRKDNQVKIRGHRIEIEEVEKVFNDLEYVQGAIITPSEDNGSLRAFVVLCKKTSLEQIKIDVSKFLSEVALPSQIDVIDGFPQTANGKIDRKKLATLVKENKADDISISPNSDDIVSIISAAWGEVLGLDKKVPEDVNFFDLGGHSLMIFKLQDAFERYLGKRPSVVSLFRHTTISAQAQLLAAA